MGPAPSPCMLHTSPTYQQRNLNKASAVLSVPFKTAGACGAPNVRLRVSTRIKSVALLSNPRHRQIIPMAPCLNQTHCQLKPLASLSLSILRVYVRQVNTGRRRR